MSETSTTGKKKPQSTKSRARRGFGLLAIAKTLPKITGRTLGKRGFAEADLLGDWTGIVGRDIAARCVPRKLNRPRRGRQGEGVLTLRVEAGFALEVQHLEPQLLERINSYFGFQAVTRLRLMQAPNTPPARERAPTSRIQPEAMTALHKRLAKVEDTELRSALDRFGQAVLRRDG